MTGMVVQLTPGNWGQESDATASSPSIEPISLLLTVIITLLQISVVVEGVW